MKPYLVWDWNGTLFDDRMLLLDAMALALAQNGFPRPSADEMQQRFARPLRAYFERLVTRELSPEEWTRLESAFRDHYGQRRHEGDLVHGARKVLADWRAEGGRQSLVSMWPHDDLVNLVQLHGLTELFDEVRGRTELTDKPANVREVIRSQNVDPADVVLVGDAKDDAIAAGEAGVAVVLVTAASLEQIRERGRQTLGCPVVDSIADVPTAVCELARERGAAGGDRMWNS